VAAGIPPLGDDHISAGRRGFFGLRMRLHLADDSATGIADASREWGGITERQHHRHRLRVERRIFTRVGIVFILWALVGILRTQQTETTGIAFMGLDCESAMMVIAFQSSPILSLPRARAAPLPRSARRKRVSRRGRDDADDRGRSSPPGRAGRHHRRTPHLGAALTHHPHVHVIVRGGGITLTFLLPVRVLGKQCGQCTRCGSRANSPSRPPFSPLQPGTPDPRRHERASEFKRRSTHFIDGTVCACGESENLGPAFAARDGNLERWLSLPLP
jgi:hypothetical protein